MGIFNPSIIGNDTFLDIYNYFFELYNEGANPDEISQKIIHEYSEMFNNYEDKNNALFALAQAQWETKALDIDIFKRIKLIVENGEDIKLWHELGANEKLIQKRKANLQKFINQISSEKERAKRRIRQRRKFTQTYIVSIISPDRRKKFTISELFTNDVYEQTGSLLDWGSGGGSILYFFGQGKQISAKWINDEILEISHEADINFTLKHESSYYFGEEIKIVYKPYDTEMIRQF